MELQIILFIFVSNFQEKEHYSFGTTISSKKDKITDICAKFLDSKWHFCDNLFIIIFNNYSTEYES
jgi:hypothetical protein